MVEYKFARVDITAAATVTALLNEWASEGWSVVSHADDGHDEYSFVLMRVKR